MLTCKTMTVSALVALAGFACAGDVVGQWQFNNNLNGDVGSTAVSHGAIGYETATINGQSATVARIGDLGKDGDATYTYGTQSNVQFKNPIGWSPDGPVFDLNGTGVWGIAGDTYQYSLLMDVKVPWQSDWVGLFDTMLDSKQNGGFGPWDEADLWVRPDHALGVAGAYAGQMPDNVWVRMAIVADLGTYLDKHNQDGKLKVYINGNLVNNMNNSYFGEFWPNRWALQENFQLFGDPTGYDSEMLVNSVQLRNYAMSAREVADLGGPTAAGIGAVPEPASMIALGLGLAGVLARRKRNR